MPALTTILHSQKNILFVTAHPDDSAIMLGGALQAAIAQQGNSHVFIAIATNGEAGQNRLAPGNETFVTDGHRTKEERSALVLLGMHSQNIFFSQLPDGTMAAKENIQRFSTELTALCDRYDITMIITLGPHNDGHPDHKATHDAGMRVAHQLAIEILSLNGDHHGEYIQELTPEMTSRKFEAASLHTSQYNAPGWIEKEGDTYRMGSNFADASPFYPPLSRQETFDHI